MKFASQGNVFSADLIGTSKKFNEIDSDSEVTERKSYDFGSTTTSEPEHFTFVKRHTVASTGNHMQNLHRKSAAVNER